MKIEKLKNEIESIWERRSKLGKKVLKKDLKIIQDSINLLDKGQVRVSEKIKNKWILNQWIKSSITVFQVTNQKLISSGPGKHSGRIGPIKKVVVWKKRI